MRNLFRILRAAFAAAIAITLLGCVAVPRYNSLDLALLPCEQGESTVFFKALEFNSDGSIAHASQLDELHKQLNQRRTTDVIVFVHGWNKNATSAEQDYQNFLCRLHARLRQTIREEKRRGGLLVLGIFWPSTISNRGEEPFPLLPASYYQIRARADHVAAEGLARVFEELTPSLRSITGSTNVPLRMHLVGHSFGGRMVVRSLEVLGQRRKLIDFFSASDSVNVVLLNAAVHAQRFEWIAREIKASTQRKTPARFTDSTSSYLFNVHSLNDSANRYLFPLASLFSDDEAGCAAGACGIPAYPTVCVNASGKVVQPSAAGDQTEDGFSINAWNVNGTEIIFSHSDIYKGRVATLVADLLYDRSLRTNLPRASHPPPTCAR